MNVPTSKLLMLIFTLLFGLCVLIGLFNLFEIGNVEGMEDNSVNKSKMDLVTNYSF